ncbi:MAG: ABC transporter ATP-binding protein [Pirellulaceae bacterium]|nr:ABC transporter ATP-binding protein [Pirellulaceae bacterium]
MLQFQQPVIRIQDAQLAYGNSPALAGLSFDLYAGEILGLLGPNGAGKTTTINCLAGRQKLTYGRIQYSQSDRLSDQMGIVPQEIAVYPDLTVLQNLNAFGRLHGVRGRDLKQRVAQALAWAALESRSDSLVNTLSGGMQRRLNIACSVLHQPTILLLDEPTVGIDPQSRERIYAMLDSLLERGTAILLTTHQLDEAQSRCDRMAIIDGGRIIESGTFEELLERTIGTSQQLCLKFAEPQSQVPMPLNLSPDGLDAIGFIAGNQQLPLLLNHFNRHGIAISTITMREPTLQHLFLHLTGKELRE